MNALTAVCCRALAVLLAFAAGASAGTFGRVVPIGGHTADIALDESRGVLYIANFTANRIEVMSLTTNSIARSMNVAAQPSALSVSPDAKYLLIAHFGNFQAPGSPNNLLTLINLDTGDRQTFALGNPPLGLAFGIDGKALVVTTTEFLLFDPENGSSELLGTIEEVTAKTLPVPIANFPPQITTAAVGASGDFKRIYGYGDKLYFSYDVSTRVVRAGAYMTPVTFAPRTIAVSEDGSYWLAGWTSVSADLEFPNQQAETGSALNIGSLAIDQSTNTIYAQYPDAETPGSSNDPTAAKPYLRILDADNFALRERLLLPENLAGRGLLTHDMQTMYAASDSGVTVLPVGSLKRQNRIVAEQEDLLFRGSFCDRRTMSQELTIDDPGGNSTDFQLKSSNPAVTFSSDSGTTPATIRVTVDGSAFANQKGTSAVEISISSNAAVNRINPVRVLINTREPDQRGAFFSLPGRLTDILPDPVRDRFYILRQDKNQVLVFDGATYKQTAVLRTGVDPQQMAISFDRRYLVVANAGSQYLTIINLETLKPEPNLPLPSGHQARTIAASSRAMLASCFTTEGKTRIVTINLDSRTTAQLPTLGVYTNEVALNTVMTGAPNGATILIAQPDGNVMLYEASSDTFVVSRKDFRSLSGPFAASNNDLYFVGNYLLNSSLVPIRTISTSDAKNSGFSFLDQGAFRTMASTQSGPGAIERLSMQTADSPGPTRIIEAPLLPSFALGGLGMGGAQQGSTESFTRTLAPLSNGQAIVSLSVSGFTVLPWNYDTGNRSPQIEKVVSAADLASPVATGGLITITGKDLAGRSQSSTGFPLPTILADSCLTANGLPVPMTLISPDQITAQLPNLPAGEAKLVLRTPGGASPEFTANVALNAPAIFRNGTAGPMTGLPLIVRTANGQLVTNSNPVRKNDTIIIVLTGLGPTDPVVEPGMAAPSDPPAAALLAPEVDLAGTSLPIIYAGLTPGQAGVYQINALVPRWVASGFSQKLTITQGSASTTLEVRVVD